MAYKVGTMSREEISRTALAQNVRIILEGPPELILPLALEEEVEVIWQQEKAKYNLYEGFVFSVSSYDETRIVGRFVHYRHYIASRQSPELQEIMQIYPLGISGLCICDKNVLVGIRDTKLATYGGYYECVPSGSIEARAYMHGEVDFVAQAMWELAEEAKIGEKKVQEVHTLGLYFSPQDGTYDLGLLLRVNLLETEMQDSDSPEYPLLQWHTFADFKKKLSSPEVKIVPMSRVLWGHASRNL